MQNSSIMVRTGGSLAWIAVAAVRGVARLWRAWEDRRQVRMLLEADDRMLADIGLTRQDVTGALSAPVGEDASRYLMRSRHERLRRRARHRLGA